MSNTNFDFWGRMSELSPIPKPIETESVFDIEEDETPTPNSTVEELTGKISELEKIISDMIKANNGNSLQTESDLSDC